MAIDCYDIAAVGQQDLIVGRDDGVVEIYYFDDSDRPTIRQTFVSNW